MIYTWDKCAKYWEINVIVPCIHGDPSTPENLESWTRMFLVIEMKSSFVTADTDVNVEDDALNPSVDGPPPRASRRMSVG